MGNVAPRLTVDVISLEEPLEGIVSVSGEQKRSFVGWLGLLSALQQGFEELRGRPDGAAAAEDRDG